MDGSARGFRSWLFQNRNDVAGWAARLNWVPRDALIALECLPAMVLPLVLGIVFDRIVLGAVACGAAATIAFGAYKPIGTSTAGPMVFALIGICLSMLVGTVAGQWPPALLAATLVWSFGCGMFALFGTTAAWIAQQCTVFLLVAATYPGHLGDALPRTGLVAAGGLLEISTVQVLRHFARPWLAWPSPRRILATAAAGLRQLRDEVASRSTATRFSLRLALVMTGTVAFYQAIALPNGYWVAMTTLLLVKSDLHATFARGLNRIGGTVVGGLLAAVIAHALRAPAEPWALAALTAAFGWLMLALQQAQYAIFCGSLTAYVVFILGYGGLAAMMADERRLLGTVLGAGFALLAHVHFHLHLREHRT